MKSDLAEIRRFIEHATQLLAIADSNEASFYVQRSELGLKGVLLMRGIDDALAGRSTTTAEPMTSGELNELAGDYGFARGQAPLMNLMRAVEVRCGVAGGRLYRWADGTALDGPWRIDLLSNPEKSSGE